MVSFRKNRTKRRTKRRTNCGTKRRTKRRTNPKINFNDLFKNLSGFGLHNTYNDGVEENELIVPTYGELTEPGYKTMIKNIKTNEYDFYDLGSGIGKVVFYSVFLSQFKKSSGVEIIEGRAKQAINAKQRALSPGYHHNNKKLKNRIANMSLTHGSMFKKSFFTNPKPCVYFLSSLCFNENMKQKLAYYFNTYRKNIKTHIFSSKPLDITVHSTYSTVSVEMSWSSSSLIYHYFISGVKK
jgi:hypothetical protein